MSEEEAVSLFEGKKFWIAQRVPTRNHWIELLEKHGGHVVKLDTQADILIADHARKGAPAGSLSWKFIEDSVKKGELQDPADYPAGAAVSSGRTMATRPAGKMSRTPYTAEDDKELWDWVTDAQSRGVSISGNRLYQDLEAKNPRHTWQSWRDRWLKSLAHRERPATTGSQPVSRDPAPPPQNVGRRRAPVSSSSRPSQSPATAAVPPTIDAEPVNHGRSMTHGKPLVLNEKEHEILSSRRGSPSDSAEEIQEPLLGDDFTDEDEVLLLDMSKDIENIDPEKMTDAWEAFAKLYPQHNAEEWQHFWYEVVRPSQDPPRLKSKKLKKSTILSPKLKKDWPAPKFSNKTQPQETVQKPWKAGSQNRDREGLEELDPRECLKTSVDLVAFLGAHESPVHFPVKEAIGGDQVFIYDICRAVTSAFDEAAEFQRPERWEEVARLLGINQSSVNIAVFKEKFSHVVDRFFEFEDFLLHLKNVQQDTGADEGDEEEVDENANLSDSPTETLQKQENLGKRRRVQMEDEAPKTPSDCDAALTNSAENPVNDEPLASKRQRIDKGKGKEPEVPSTPEALYRPRPQLTQYQNIAQDPETQDFHFPQATEEEESLYNHSEQDSPSNQIRDEVYRATQRSPEPDEAHREVARRKIDRYMALGYTEDVVREALGATTSNDQNAAIVMEDLTQGKGIPDNVRGIWTAEDDLTLREAGGMERMIEKHGSDYVEDRMIWLEAIEEIRRGGELE